MHGSKELRLLGAPNGHGASILRSQSLGRGHRRFLMNRQLIWVRSIAKSICARVDQLLVLGMGDFPPLIGNPYNGAL